MKLRLGSKFYQIRNERQLTQKEMADLLGMPSSTYSRIERGETSVNLDELPGIATSLGIGVHELLPETVSISNNSNNHQGGSMVFGTIVNNYYGNEKVEELEKKIKEQSEEIIRLTSLLPKNSEGQE